MTVNEEALRLIVTEQGADQTAAKLRKLENAALSVIGTTKLSEAAFKAETHSLLDLDKALQRQAASTDKVADAEKRLAAGRAKGGGFGAKANSLAQVADIASPATGGAIRGIGDIAQAQQEFGKLGTFIAGGGVIAGAAAIAFEQMNKNLEAVRAQVVSVTDANRDYYAAIAGGKTTADIKKQVDELIALRDAEARSLADQQNATAESFAYAQQQFGDLGARIVFATGNIGTTTSESEKKVADFNAQIDSLTRLLDDGALKANDLAVAEAQLTKMRDAQLQQQVTRETQALSMIRNASVKSVEDRIKANLDEQQSIAAVIASGEASADMLKTLSDRLGVLTDDTANLQDAILPVVQARENELKLMAYQQQQFKDTAAAMTRYNSDIESLNQKDLESRERLRDALIAIADQAAEAAQKSLDKLLQQQAQLATALGRDEDKALREAAQERLTLQTDSYRAEIAAYTDYKRKLRDIDLRAADAAFELALNRDFSGLFSSNRNVDISKRDATIANNDAIEDEREAYQQRQADLITHLQFERNERMIAFQQQIADTVSAYQQEQVQIQAQRAQAEAKAKDARRIEAAGRAEQYNTRVRFAQAELAMMNQTERQRFSILSATQNALIAQSRQLLAMALPSSSAGGGNNFAFNPTYHITGNDADAIGRVVEQRTMNVIRNVIGVTR